MTHIQKTAPGPPRAMAVATPTMLPVPTLPERATQKASNEEIPCLLPSGAFSGPANRERIMSPKRRTCTKRVRSVKYNPAPTSRTTSAGLQTMLLRMATILSNMVIRGQDI